MGFARINSLLGATAAYNVCHYVWNEDNTVALMNSYFDEEHYRRSKLAAFVEKYSSLSFSDLKAIVDRVFAEHQQLVLDISWASPENWKELDRKLDAILHEEVISAENEAQLKISRNNIKRVQPTGDSWMSYQEVNAMLSLLSRHKFDPPVPGKFVNQSRQ
jgi:hypothetical protein